MDLDTFIEAWNDFTSCDYWDAEAGHYGRIGEIDHYGPDGYCARVDFVFTTAWYGWSAKGRLRRVDPPQHEGTGIIPPGCSL